MIWAIKNCSYWLSLLWYISLQCTIIYDRKAETLSLELIFELKSGLDEYGKYKGLLLSLRCDFLASSYPFSKNILIKIHFHRKIITICTCLEELNQHRAMQYLQLSFDILFSKFIRWYLIIVRIKILIWRYICL